jgi:hypothetical protein
MTGIDDLVRQAAVLATFDVPGLAEHADATSVVTFLQDRCQRVETPAGAVVWSLTDGERRNCLATVDRRELRRTREAVSPPAASDVQRALDASLGDGWSEIDLAHLSPAEARALVIVAGWWSGHHPGVPPVEQAARLVERLNLFADVRAMAADHFVDRIEIREQLRDAFGNVTRAAVMLHGVGGIGKSALLAQHILWAAEDPDGPHAYVALLDFDDPSLNPLYHLDICHRLILMIARQAGEQRPQLQRLAEVARDAARTSGRRLETSSRGSASPGVDRPSMQLLDELEHLAQRPVLVVFDTAEQVQRRGELAAVTFAGLVESLVRHPGLNVVVSGRADMEQLRARPVELGGLDLVSAGYLLHRISGRPLTPAVTDEILTAIGTSPLTVRLAARVLADPATEPGDLLTMNLRTERIDGELYRRVLRHIRNPEVRKLAHPGLVLRRITPSIIAEVLAGPCDLDLPLPFSADGLFQDLQNEAMLVTWSPQDGSLVHRSDIRRMMLPQLLADQPAKARQIQEAAVRFHAARTTRSDKVEEMYHRLMLDQPAAELDAHWDEKAAVELAPDREEFPPDARLHLLRRLPETYLDDDDRLRLNDASWVAEVEPQALRALASGEAAEALSLVRERRAPDGSSLLPGPEIEALEALGDFTAAVRVARDHRKAAALAGNTAGVTTYSLHAARLHERAGQPTEARSVLREAIATVRMPGTDRLRLIVALLGLDRRAAAPRDESLSDEAARLFETLGVPALLQVPGLLRDLAAEIGAEHPGLLDTALRIIGLDASADGAVPAGLREVEDWSAGLLGSPGTVLAELRIKTYEDIVRMPRGETGQGVFEVLRSVPVEVAGLRTAVQDEYRRESDAVLLGRTIDYGPKA